MLARVGPLASANFAMLLAAGIAYRAFESTGSLADAPAASRAVQAAGFLAAGPGAVALGAAMVLGLAGAFAGLALSKPVAKRMLGARVVSAPRSDEEVWLVSTVRMLADRYRIGVPEIAIHDSAKQCAAATGFFRDRMLLTLSTGLLRTRGYKDVEGMLSREFARIAHGHLITFALVQGALNGIVLFAFALAA